MSGNHDIKAPSTRDRWIFAVLWALFCVLLSRMIVNKPQGLVVGAIVTGAAWLISLAFNKEGRKAALLGLAIPVALIALWGLAKVFGAEPKPLVWGLIGIGAVGGLAVALIPAVGGGFYRGWMKAAEPLGWTFSRIILGMVLWVVMTPVGFILKMTGKDPMERGFDRAATTYWKPHGQRTDPAGYFRQS